MEQFKKLSIIPETSSPIATDTVGKGKYGGVFPIADIGKEQPISSVEKMAEERYPVVGTGVVCRNFKKD